MNARTMNARAFVCCLVQISGLLSLLAGITHAQQAAPFDAATLPAKAIEKTPDGNDGFGNDGLMIPFQYDPPVERHIIVQVSINGKPPLPFILDTGLTTALVVFPTAAKALGLRPGLQTQNMEAFGQIVSLPVAPVKTARLTGIGGKGIGKIIGKGITFPVSQVQVADASAFGQANPLAAPVSGIIGLGMLTPNLSGVRFDFEAKTMTVFTKTDLSFGIKRATILPMTRRDETWPFAVSVGYTSEKSVDLMLDTGSPLTQLPVSVVSSLRPVGEIPSFMSSLTALYVTTDMLLDRLTLGGYAVPSVVVTIFPQSPTYSLGLNILSRFRITLDFRNKQMVIQNYSHPLLGELVTGYEGYLIEKQNNRYVVAHIDKGSPAQEAGVHVGDKILTVDGRSPQMLSILQAGMLVLGTAGTRTTLLLERATGKRFTTSFFRTSVFDHPRMLKTGLILKRPVGAPITVLGVRKGSLGDQAGLQEGDQIIELGGEKAATMPYELLLSAFGSPNLTMAVQRLGDSVAKTIHLATGPREDAP